MIFTSSLTASPFVLTPGAVKEVFGAKYSSEVYGGTFYAFGFSAVLVPIIAKALDTAHAADTKPYLYINLMGTATGIIGLITLYFVNMSTYKYKYY